MQSHSTNSSAWESPSNIALVKYWGKHGNQLPQNPSLSMSLKKSVSKTKLTASETHGSPGFEFFFEGKPAPAFELKIRKFLELLSDRFTKLGSSSLKIESSNTFPHSAGIASSASSMSALALCLCDIYAEGKARVSDSPEFFRFASEIARLGSGSASRSVYGGFSVWGKTELVKGSSDEYAVPLDFTVSDQFRNLHDAILVVSSKKKDTSSTAGHNLMVKHPYARERYVLANKNLEVLITAMKKGDTNEFIRITENEALGLHSLMMSSDPGFILIQPNTLEIISKIRSYRERTGAFMCFTLDAGPNVHLLYPVNESKKIEKFIRNDLLSYCENQTIIWDECGGGPVKFL